MNTPDTGTREGGQVVAMFAIALVAIIAMTGLVLDGGSTFVQRRDMQNVSDAASMAAAYDYVNSGSTTSAEAAARQVAAANGYVEGSNGVAITVTPNAGANGTMSFAVSIQKPHANMFSGVVGLSSWNVSTTATARTGAPNAAIGAAPVIFNEDAFPGALNPGDEIAFDQPDPGNQDVPQGPNQFNWTIWCTANGNPCNANSDGVRDMIKGIGKGNTVTPLVDVIGPMNAGAHATLFSDFADHVGKEFPVGIVRDDGTMVGWAVFKLTGSVGGSTKQIRGYFVTPTDHSALTINGGAGLGTSAYGAYSVKLVN